jgi:hypothetical protein
VHGNTPWHHRFLWMWYLRCLREFDLNYVYRWINVQEALSYGAKNVHVLKPYFIPWQDQPVVLSEVDKQRFDCDVVYVGHYDLTDAKSISGTLIRDCMSVYSVGELDKVLGDLSTLFGAMFRSTVQLCKGTVGKDVWLFSKLNRDTPRDAF